MLDEDGVIQEEAIIETRQQAYKPRLTHHVQDAIHAGSDETSALLAGERNRNELPDAASEWSGYKDFEGEPWWRKPSIYWMLPVFALYTIAFGGVLVPRVNLMQDLICRDYLSEHMVLDPLGKPVHIEPGQNNNPLCDSPEISGRAAIFLMGDGVLCGLLGALVAPYLGHLSDRYGRKPVLIFTSFGGFIREIMSIFAATYPDTFPVGLFYLGFIADGACGSFVCGLAISHSYATDCTPPRKRNVAFGLFQGVMFTGIGLGPILAAYLIKRTGTLLTIFYFAFFAHLVFMAVLAVIVPESLSKRRQLENRKNYEIEKEAAKNKATLPIWATIKNYPLAFFRPLKILWPTGEGSSPALRRNLVLLCTIDTVMFGVAMGAIGIIIIYTRKQFHFGTVEQSEMISAVSIVRVTCLFVILPILSRLLRGKTAKWESAAQTGCDWVDLLLIRVGILIDTVGFLGYTLSTTGPMFILSGCFTALGTIASPTMQSALTKHVPRDKTGQLLGASAMLHALARVAAPLIFNTIFYATVASYTPAVFLCLTIAFGVAWVLTWFLRAGVYLDDTSTISRGVVEDADEADAVGRE